MQPVEKLPHIPRLRPQPRPRRLNDFRIQPQPLRNIDPRRRPRHSDLQLIRRLQSRFIKPNRAIHHSRRSRRENFQRRVMCGNNRDASYAQKMISNGHRQRRAFFRIGRRPQLIQQHQRPRRRRPRNEINIGDVRRKRRKILLDRLIIADVGQHRIKHRRFHPRRRNRNPRLRHQRQQPRGLQPHGLAARVRPRNNQLPPLALKFDRRRNNPCGADALARRL